MDRGFRGCDSEVGEGRVSSWGLELVPFLGSDVGVGSGGGGSVEEGLFDHLGWVQELVDDRLAMSNSLFSPLEVREPVGSWNDGEKITYGMSQAEVSKWVLKRINGFSKFLGVSYDGFEDRTMQLFTEIEEKWRKGAESEEKKSRNKSNRGVRELKSLKCSVNYEGRKKVGERSSGEVEGVNLLTLYED